MARCCVCNTEDECFEVVSGSQHFFFDRVDCAVKRLDAQCAHCGDRIYDEAVELDGQSYCSVQCAYVRDELVEKEVPAGLRRVVRPHRPAPQLQSALFN